MKTFDDLRASRSLERFLGGPMGTLYFDPTSTWSDRVLVRHFDSTYLPEDVAAYADLIKAVKDWVRGHFEVNTWVHLHEPIEVGADYLVRPYPMYQYSTDSYDGAAGSPPAPDELAQMQQAVRAALSQDQNPSGSAEVIARVVARSLLEPTGRTFFDENNRRFIVVEPKIDRVDVDEWVTMRQARNAVFRSS